MSRIAIERAFHDEQAERRRPDLPPDALRFADDDYLDHESWLRPAFDQLGDVRGRSVLDLGCGHGMAAVVLARRGARTVALELSAGYLHEATRRAEANGVTVLPVQADAQRLPFADASFDCIWGHAILHHLDVDTAADELARVLKPGGRAVLCEPWDGNPLLRWARRRLPYPGKHHTPDEDALRSRSLVSLRRRFPNLKWRGFQFLGMVRRAFGDNLATRTIGRIDRLLLAAVPVMQRGCRYVVLTLPRSPENE